MEKTQTPPKKMKRAKGPIRWGAVLPFLVLSALTSLYMHFFFDGHLRRGLEWGFTKALGVQVDVAELNTSFFNASIRIAGVDITDSEKPQRNSLSIGEIRFGMGWDALLRAKILIDEAIVDKIEFGKPRPRVGWVKPPEPPPIPDGKPGLVDKLKGQALNEVQEKYDENVFGDLAAVLGGSNSQAQFDKLEKSLESKKMAKDLEVRINAKQKEWADRLKTLPKGSEFEALGERLKAVKTKDFKSPQELQTSLQQLDGIFKEADAKIKTVQSAKSDLDADLAKINTDVKALEAQIKTDIRDLEKHFKIPQIDAKALTMALLHKQTDGYMTKFKTYRALAEQYLPPNVLKKGSKEPDPAIQPRPRAKGVTYEFGRPNSYPLFWLRRAAVSSQAGFSPYSGTVKGEILDVTTNQVLTGKPTIANFAGDFPGMGISGATGQITIDNRREESVIDLVAAVKSYAIEGRELVTNDDVKIGFRKAAGALQAKASLQALKIFELNFGNQFQNIDYEIQAKNETVDTLLENIFKAIPSVTLDGRLSGTFPQINTSLNSNLGPELQKGLEREVNAKIAETRAKIEKYVSEEVGKTKAEIDAQIAKIRQQVEGEVKKVQAQADAQKKQVESKSDQAKKETENSAKKSLEKEASKAAEELKKRLGF